MLTVQFIELIGPNSVNSAIAAGGSASPIASSATIGWQAGSSTKRTQVRYSPTSLFQSKRGPVVGRMSKWRVKGGRALRSEEHTSELQSLMRFSYAVFCLKTKTKYTYTYTYNTTHTPLSNQDP